MADDDIDNMDFDLPGVTPVVGSSSSAAGHTVGGAALDPHSNPAIKEMTKRWFCLYPVYIDADKSSAEGRKISKSHSVKNPAAIYMAEAARSLGFNVVFEQDKRHPRDAFTFGRLRVQILREDGLPTIPAYPTKKKLLVQIASMLEEVKKRMIESDPKIEAFAALTRSEMSKNVDQLASAAVKEMKKEALGQSSQKKNKKKK